VTNKRTIFVIGFLLCLQQSVFAEVTDKLPPIYSWIPYTIGVFLVHFLVALHLKNSKVYACFLFLLNYCASVFTPLGAVWDSYGNNSIKESLEKEIGYGYNNSLLLCWIIVISPFLIFALKSVLYQRFRVGNQQRNDNNSQ
jgi:predicted neutral ceramidase superfamily lipid hydrolase